ncbi:MAG: HD domain-containing phosphohydrolase [Nitrospirota bacterium]|nr:HD domain-containing phosphohydrolase [Nitrospirota bacterium]
MHKTIPIEKLAIGMEVIALDKSWLETNILSHRFQVRSKDEICKLRENGIRMVTVSVSEGSCDDSARESGHDSRRKGVYFENDDLFGSESAPEFRDLDLGTSQDLREWNALQSKTVAVVTKSFDALRMGSGFDVQALRNQVIETIEMTLHNPAHNSFLVTLTDVDDETYVHSANTMVLAMGLAAQTGVPREELAAWGMAALLHDIGKSLIPLDILKKPGRLTQEEWVVMKRHPDFGFSILSKNKDSTIRGLCATVCLEHHERKNGMGYPNGTDLQHLNPVSRSLMVLDIYEALTAGRIYLKPMAPAKTLAYLLENELHRLDPKAVVRLVQMIGIYPIGSFVELSDGRIALVAEYMDPETHTGPVNLIVLFSALSMPLSEPVPITLPMIDRQNVQQTFHPRELGLSSSDVVRYLENAGTWFTDGP